MQRQLIKLPSLLMNNVLPYLCFSAKIRAIQQQNQTGLPGGLLSNEQRLAERRQHSVPVLEKIKTLLDHFSLTLTPKNPLAVATAYSLKRWNKLILFAENGLLEIDNNPVENAIRPIAVGRKNYLFAGSHDSAQRAAIAYTILAACKSANINPVEYLADVLQKLPTRNVNEVVDLIPSQWTAKKIAVEEGA
jgi:hypothetical protein